MKDDKIAKGMFLTGCAGLPLLWFVNVLYFRKQVFGPIPYLDDPDDDDENDEANETSPIVAPSSSADTADDDDDDDSDASSVDARSPEEIKAEVAKWVQRSTMGSAVGFAMLLSWVVYFQTKGADTFGPGWYVMSEEEGSRTGW